jgi:hypothetical protein
MMRCATDTIRFNLNSWTQLEVLFLSTPTMSAKCNRIPSDLQDHSLTRTTMRRTTNQNLDFNVQLTRLEAASWKKYIIVLYKPQVPRSSYGTGTKRFYLMQ